MARSGDDAQPSRDALVVIPARLGSTRLARKALLAESGKPLVQHVYEAARRSREVSRVVVATDSEEIAAAVRRFGGEAALTDPSHASGSDRVAEVARRSRERFVVNVQGDEPEASALAIDALVRAIRSDAECGMATVAYPLEDPRAFEDPNQVKVVLDRESRALYFSRAPVPHPRNPPAADGARPLGHAGLYAFERETLFRFTACAPAPLERVESLEQLRALENGIRIRVVVGPWACRGIDTREDYDGFLARERVRSKVE
jgi:3-deoxy-manno-octulosonate cytidylyltransferase (CMP-KDO synthetase)